MKKAIGWFGAITVLCLIVLTIATGCGQQSLKTVALRTQPAYAPVNYENGVYFFPKTGFERDSEVTGSSDLSDFIQENSQLEIVSVAAVNAPYGETTGFLVVFRVKK